MSDAINSDEVKWIYTYGIIRAVTNDRFSESFAINLIVGESRKLKDSFLPFFDKT